MKVLTLAMITLPFLRAYTVSPERKAAVPNIEHHAIEDLMNNLNPYKPGYDVKKIHDTVRGNLKLGEVILSSSKTCDKLINITHNSTHDRNLRLHAMWTLGLSGVYSNHSSEIGKIRNIITVLERNTNDTHLRRAANWTLGKLAHVTSPETKISNMRNLSILIVIISLDLFCKRILTKQLKYKNENDLMKACRSGDMKNFSDLIKRHDVNAINKDGSTALMMAAQAGYTECVKALIQANASVNQGRTSDGITPLCLAILNGQEDCVRILLGEKITISRDLKDDDICLISHEKLSDDINDLLGIGN